MENITLLTVGINDITFSPLNRAARKRSQRAMQLLADERRAAGYSVVVYDLSYKQKAPFVVKRVRR